MSKDLKQLEQCMDHLAYVFDELGVTKAEFAHGAVKFLHNGSPVNQNLINSLCQHVSDLRKDELAAEDDNLPEFYFE
jgi:hypothetical protein